MPINISQSAGKSIFAHNLPQNLTPDPELVPFLGFCIRHLEGERCLSYFHTHGQLLSAYRLRTYCTRDHLVVPPSDGPCRRGQHHRPGHPQSSTDPRRLRISLPSRSPLAPPLGLSGARPRCSRSIGLDRAGSGTIPSARKQGGQMKTCSYCNYHTAVIGSAYCLKCRTLIQHRLAEAGERTRAAFQRRRGLHWLLRDPFHKDTR